MKTPLRALKFMVAAAFASDTPRAWLLFALTAFNAALSVLSAYWLKLLIDGALSSSSRLIVFAALGLAASSLFTGLMAWYGFNLRTVLAEKTSVFVDLELIEITAGLPGIEHHERPDYQNELSLLRFERDQLAFTVSALVGALAVLVQLATSSVLLWGVHPVLVALPLFGIPPVWAGAKAVRVSHAALDETAERERMATHLFKVGTTASAGKELRIFSLGGELVARHRRLWDEVNKYRLAKNYRAAAITSAGSAAFAVGYVVAAVFAVWMAMNGDLQPSQVVLVLTLAGTVNAQVEGAVSSMTLLMRSIKVASRLVWLSDYAAERRGPQIRQQPLPTRITREIAFEDLSFRYPGTDWEVLEDVSLRLSAGSTVAFVGENGAGKTTLVKLLARFYEPSAGRITIDGTDISSFDINEWRHLLSAGFQDFMRFELIAGEVVGVGEVSEIDNAQFIGRAVNRAGALDVIDGLPKGYETQLGRSFDDGIDLSGGQWQKLALSRAMMRDPLLLILDEPTSGLDAETEHQLFLRYVEAGRRIREEAGAITVLVSHRFSTVRMADLIVVLADGKIDSQGSHRELMQVGGLYAELYEMQASSYR